MGRRREGEKEGYAGRGRVMHIDVDVHEFFILSYDFESHSLARKSISPPLGRDDEKKSSIILDTILHKIKDKIVFNVEV